MNQHHRRIEAAYPGLLPGFFTLTENTISPPRHIPQRMAWRDPSEAPPPRDGRRGNRRYRRLWQEYLEECAAAMSVLLQFCDAVQVGETIVVTAALSAEEFDYLAAIGADLADYENDDPGEDSDPAEDDGAAEDGDVDEVDGCGVVSISPTEEIV